MILLKKKHLNVENGNKKIRIPKNIKFRLLNHKNFNKFLSERRKNYEKYSERQKSKNQKFKNG